MWTNLYVLLLPIIVRSEAYKNDERGLQHQILEEIKEMKSNENRLEERVMKLEQANDEHVREIQQLRVEISTCNNFRVWANLFLFKQICSL